MTTVATYCLMDCTHSHPGTYKPSQISHEQHQELGLQLPSPQHFLGEKNLFLDRRDMPLWTQQLPWGELSPLNLVYLVFYLS